MLVEIVPTSGFLTQKINYTQVVDTRDHTQNVRILYHIPIIVRADCIVIFFWTAKLLLFSRPRGRNLYLINI